ncbi:MAG: DUF4185 domain-containing protein [Deltaproteobacteria bacterium]|jgi:hypothetical protein|nr:DUF4185 domain-containing protein [Deltaproteobacteria bacterium]MBW2534962.1 DUF4185 domain-containing protein [Deltaproteobacteria bacterium]
MKRAGWGLWCAVLLAGCSSDETSDPGTGGQGAIGGSGGGGLIGGAGGTSATGGAGGGTAECDTPPIADAPYPPSPILCDLTWGSTIYRDPSGDSDNWPVTWGDDDALYTAYGDGHGFPPGTASKLSLGFAKVTGSPDSFVGENIPSPSGEQTGDGASGKKASGILMVDGVLYLWMRNADQAGSECQLASSTDHAQTWTAATWTLPELGYCTFINYGQNYAGARDDFVYMVSHDDPSAYEAADHFVLTRVPKAQILERAAYEFFVAVDGTGQPSWSSDVADRGPVFTHTGLCRRSGISYSAALGRYLWWQQLSETTIDTRYEGGLGIYDAPEPWGPWTTVYFTELWDEGPGDAASFPTKWMSDDGRTAWLVHSGEDTFSVREATFTLAGD